MAKLRSIKNSFLGGQISPTALGRTDLPQYPHACKTLLNVIPMTSGGAYRRPGTLSATAQPISAFTAPRLFPFVVSRTESYCLLFSSLPSTDVAFFKSYRASDNSTSNLSSGTCTGTPPYRSVTLFGGTAGIDDELQEVQYCQSNDEMYLTHQNHKPQLVLRTAIDAFTIQNFDAGLIGQPLVNAYPYINQNPTGVTIQPSAKGTGTNGSPTTGTSINLTASAGLFDPNVTSTSDGAGSGPGVGSIIVINQGNNGPSAAGGDTTAVGAAIITSVLTGNPYVQANGLSNTCVANVLVPFATSATAYASWWESAWSPSRGWPGSCCLFLSRLVMASTPYQPDAIWFTETDGYGNGDFIFSLIGSTLNFDQPESIATASGSTTTTVNSQKAFSTIYIALVDDSEGDGASTGPTGAQPFKRVLSQNTQDKVQWLSPDKELLVGTLSQEWILSPQNGDFSVGNSPTVLQSKYGSDHVQAVRIGYELIFPYVTQDEVGAYQYNYIDASFFSEPVQLYFDQYPQAEPSGNIRQGRRKLRYMDWDVTRKTLWCIDTAGNFYGMTRDRKLGVTMWHTHQFGGYNASQGKNFIAINGYASADSAYGNCDGSVNSFAIVPNPFSGINDIWLCVKRLAGTSWQIERMIGKNTVRQSAFEQVYPGPCVTEPYCVDAAMSYGDPGSPSALGTQVNCGWLNGYTLTGAYYSPTTGINKIITTGAVVSGSGTIEGAPSDYGTATNWVTLGLPFTPTIVPVRVEAGSVIGTAQGAIAKIQRAFVRLFNSMALYVQTVGPEQEASQVPEFVNCRTGAQPAGVSAEVFTGLKKVNVPAAYDRDGCLELTCPDPLPWTVVSVIMEGTEYD